LGTLVAAYFVLRIPLHSVHLTGRQAPPHRKGKAMPKYLIERHMTGAGNLSSAELEVLSEKSCCALDELGSDIQWVENAGLIRDHALMSGLPADAVSEVVAIIDPSRSWRTHWEEEHDMSKESGIY
jgi:hypothetical protein